MDENLLKNSLVLARLLLVIISILGLIIFAVVEFFKIGSSSISGVAGIVGAMLVGQIYAMKFKEIMSKRLRVHVTIIYILAQIVLGSLYFSVLGVPNLLLFLGVLIGINLFYSLLIYWLLGSGGKSYLKAMQKRDALKK